MKRILCAAAILLASLALAAPAQELSTEQLEKYLNDKKVFFLDVREPDEVKKLGSIEGYVNIPLGQLEKRLKEVPKDKLIITL
ncbi:MAG: rhodanese-like domain-containing protein [Bryobacteraceae bacterium]|nr:rhodanese-like domain-containing protein [Bryobacteraceae bacterium]